MIAKEQAERIVVNIDDVSTTIGFKEAVDAITTALEAKDREAHNKLEKSFLQNTRLTDKLLNKDMELLTAKAVMTELLMWAEPRKDDARHINGLAETKEKLLNKLIESRMQAKDQEIARLQELVKAVRANHLREREEKDGEMERLREKMKSDLIMLHKEVDKVGQAGLIVEALLRQMVGAIQHWHVDQGHKDPNSMLSTGIADCNFPLCNLISLPALAPYRESKA